MSSGRDALMGAFLERAGWADAAQTVLAGDASARRYFRVHRGSDSAVLMDANPALGENVWRFLEVGSWLTTQGYSAPLVLAADPSNGFLLLEDLGDALVARLVAATPERERALYLGITDFLCDLQQRTPPAFLAVADGDALADLSARVADWYLPAIDLSHGAVAEVIGAEVAAAYRRLSDGRLAVSLRDFHAENLIWLPERTGVAQFGLLDFQDAFVTHPAYDLVSLCQDARRDVSAETEAACVAAYTAAIGFDPADFGAVYALLGAQRALRIVGIFARLCLKTGKVHYVDYIPRVWAYLARNLRHPELRSLAGVVDTLLPPPTEDRLQRIKEKCGTRPDL